MSYESAFNPDSLLTSSSRNSKIISKLPTPTNNYAVPAISSASRPDSPNKKKMITPASMNSQQQQTKTKPVPLSLSNSHMLLTTHHSTSGPTTGNNSSGTKSAFSVVVPSSSSSSPNVKVPAEDGDVIVNKNMFLKDGSVDVLHSINNSNNQFRVVTTTELLGTNNLHLKQASSLSETVTSGLQNSYTNTSGRH